MAFLPQKTTLLSLAALAVLAPLTLSSEAHAQPRGNLAVDQFTPAPSGDSFFQIQGYGAGAGKADFSAMLLADYGRNPLVVYNVKDGKPDTKAGALVSDQLFLHVGASVGFFERLQLSVDFPVAVVDRGDSVTTQGQTFSAPSGGAVGDLRGGMRLRLFGERKSPIGAALTGYVFIPTGNDDKYAGAGTLRGNPALTLGGRLGPLLWGLNGGVMIQKANTFALTKVGNSLTFGGGLALVTADDAIQIGPEFYGTTLLDKGGDPGALPAFDRKDTNLEMVLGIKGRLNPIVLGAAAGPGLTPGAGTPALRALLSIAYAPIITDRDQDGVLDEDDACPDVPGVHTGDPATNGCPPPPDRDEDGVLDRDDACPDVPGKHTEDPKTNGCPDKDGDLIFDKDDACPDVPGVRDPDPTKNGCPLADRDKDNILDKDDACPDLPGVPDLDPKKNGCPPDRDGDSIFDIDDACPDVPGVASADPKKNGCPPDTDGDGINDDKDACPTEAGKPDVDPKKNGCPMVFVRGGSIVITEQVQFRTGSDFILPASDELLTNVNKVFEKHPEITMVLIEGHTDNVGGKAYNVGLSNRRAASVKKWLVKHGVDVKRLDSKGFGMSVPIGDNTTEEGRQINRRVEFKILDGAKQPDVAVKTTGKVPTPPPPAPKPIAVPAPKK